jgi:glucosamine kinase
MDPMILIADSGSTKTTWSLTGEKPGTTVSHCLTSGINPFYQTETEILRVLHREFTLPVPESVRVYFYGAGCSGEVPRSIVSNPLQQFFHPAALVVQSDLLAAARSLCGQSSGIACILGTGSNSCLYDGHVITEHVLPLGYILGDEGSGADIGRRLVSDVLKNQLPREAIERFFLQFPFTAEELLEKVYKHPFPNRFLAGFTLFVHENLDIPELRQLVSSGFRKFFNRNIGQYTGASTRPVHFSGSIAYFFRDLLNQAAADSGFHMGQVVQDPLEGLIRFHQNS